MILHYITANYMADPSVVIQHEERYPCLSTSWKANGLTWIPPCGGMTTDWLLQKIIFIQCDGGC